MICAMISSWSTEQMPVSRKNRSQKTKLLHRFWFPRKLPSSRCCMNMKPKDAQNTEATSFLVKKTDGVNPTRSEDMVQVNQITSGREGASI